MTDRDLLRFTIATIAYRFQLSVHGAKNSFGAFEAGQNTRNPNAIIQHMYELLHATILLTMYNTFNYEPSESLHLSAEVERFNAALQRADETIASATLNTATTKRMLQGPLADILTHIGQISMLRRLHGDPVHGKNYSTAAISIGKLDYF